MVYSFVSYEGSSFLLNNPSSIFFSLYYISSANLRLLKIFRAFLFTIVPFSSKVSFSINFYFSSLADNLFPYIFLPTIYSSSNFTFIIAFKTSRLKSYKKSWSKSFNSPFDIYFSLFCLKSSKMLITLRNICLNHSLWVIFSGNIFFNVSFTSLLFSSLHYLGKKISLSRSLYIITSEFNR